VTARFSIRPSPEYLTLRAWARRVGVGVKVARRWAREGHFPAYRPNGEAGWTYVRRAEADAWLRAQRVTYELDDPADSIERRADAAAERHLRALD
jgi:hypothetical protein